VVATTVAPPSIIMDMVMMALATTMMPTIPALTIIVTATHVDKPITVTKSFV